MKKILLAIILVVISGGGGAHAGWPWGPSDYAECVAKYVAPAKCKRALIILNVTCRMQFEYGRDSSEWLSYYNCVRDGMKDVETEQAAVIVHYSCMRKYSNLYYYDKAKKRYKIVESK